MEKTPNNITCQNENRGNPIYQNIDPSPPGSEISNQPEAEYVQCDGEEDEQTNDEQVLEGRVKTTNNRNAAHSSVGGRQTKKKDVADLFDEDNYALPDVEGCVTKGMGASNNSVSTNSPTKSSRRKKRKISRKMLKIGGFATLLLLAGVMGAIAVLLITGTIFTLLIHKNILLEQYAGT